MTSNFVNHTTILVGTQIYYSMLYFICYVSMQYYYYYVAITTGYVAMQC